MCPSTVVSKVEEAFPGSLSSDALVEKVGQTLKNHGYDDETTLVATSLCCDEVNREIELHLKKKFENNFSMGGLAGFPFGGATSFGAMAHHIPDNGNCIVIYGPHVGIDADGNVGKVNRRGRHGGSGVCCGSATEAAGYVKKVMKGEAKAPTDPDSPFDAQQNWVRAALLPHGERLAKSNNPLVELPLALFECQDELIKEIVENMCGELNGARIALVGGIQINTPEGTPDYFLPKVFDLKDEEGDGVVNLLASFVPRHTTGDDQSGNLSLTDSSFESLSAKDAVALKMNGSKHDTSFLASWFCGDTVMNMIPTLTQHNPVIISTVRSSFSGALTNDDLLSKVASALEKYGYKDDTTLVATSLCCDEVNRDMDHHIRIKYGNNFSMGGLAGFPFGGATSFGAMAHHIPDDGSCIVIYGPHVGIDSDGTVGKVNRRGRHGSSGVCCGSATEAAGHVKKVLRGNENASVVPTGPYDAQQSWVRSALLPHGNRLARSSDPLVELPLALFDSQNKLMKKIVKKMSGEVHNGLIALVGGIQINTPRGTPDFFLPKVFELKNNKGETVADLMATLQ